MPARPAATSAGCATSHDDVRLAPTHVDVGKIDFKRLAAPVAERQQQKDQHPVPKAYRSGEGILLKIRMDDFEEAGPLIVVQTNAFAARLEYMALEFARLTAQDVASVADGGETPVGDVKTIQGTFEAPDEVVAGDGDTCALRRTGYDHEFVCVRHSARCNPSSEGSLAAQILVERVRLVGAHTVTGPKAFVEVNAATGRPLMNMRDGPHLVGQCRGLHLRPTQEQHPLVRGRDGKMVGAYDERQPLAARHATYANTKEPCVLVIGACTKHTFDATRSFSTMQVCR